MTISRIPSTTKMMVEFTQTPLAIGTRSPRFSWEVPFPGRGKRQSAYQILVASQKELCKAGRADLWDSGRVTSDQSANVPYSGKDLVSNQDCYWLVRIWDEQGNEAGALQVDYFGTALFDEADWKGQWIGMGDPHEPFSDPDTFQQDRVAQEIDDVEPDPRSPILRKDFTIEQPIRRARAFVCGLGLYELRLNGTKVGDDVLSTPRTEFRKRVLYSTYDVTAQLSRGDNVVGLILGSGWFNGQKKYWGWQMQWYGSPRAIVQLEIELEDGSVTSVVSDNSWQGDWSPITFDCIYDGEDYDARLEQTDWDRPGFDAGSWQKANIVSAPGGKLVPMTSDPERVTERIQPASLSEPKPELYVYDLGCNIAGWVRLKVNNAAAGSLVKLRFAEEIHDNGTLNGSSHGDARHEDNYITKGAGDEVYEPRFTYHGFRYVEVTGYPGIPDLNCVEGCFTRVAVDQTGTFECASELINNIHRCTLQSQLCNIQMGVPTDDTQRTERLGWGADAWGTATEALYNLWMPRLYSKWISDFCDQQDELGMVGMIAPQAGAEEDLVWTSAFLLIPWWQYLHCGDRRILDSNYPSFQRYITFLEKTGVKQVTTAPPDQVINALLWRSGNEGRFPSDEDRGHLQISQWGDHLATAEGSASRANLPLSMATAFYYLDVSIMAMIARILGREDDTSRYRALAVKIGDAFNERFFDSNVGYYDTGVQSAQAWPLVFGLVPDEHRERLAAYLCDSVENRQRHLTTGYAGTKFAILALAMAERNDIVWKLATSTSYPSWAYMLRNDRTTTCETWDGESGSFNHAPLGAAIDEWFYSDLAGIRPDETGPGYEKIIFKPYLPPELSWARASLDTMRGSIVSAWRREGTLATLSIEVPSNSTATVYIPSSDREQISEGDCPAEKAADVTFLRSESHATVFTTSSGTYQFTFPTA